MKFVLFRMLGILFFSLFLAGMVWIGLIREIVAPFVDLPERILLFSHINYIFLLASAPLFLGFIAILLYQIFDPKRDVFSYGKWWNLVVFTTLIVGAIALGNRLYLGYRVDQAHYVKCPKESRTSAKSSWRVYAKSPDLCKDSSGIAGG